MPCFHCASTSSQEYRWNSTSCPEGVPRKKKGISTAKAAAEITSRGNHNNGRLSTAGGIEGKSFSGVAMVRSVVRIESSVARFPTWGDSHRFESIFNRDLTLLKSPRNADRIPFSHWGGTDHEGRGARA